MICGNALGAAASICLFLLIFSGGVAGGWDYIVVGAGASGCALSSQLASDASKSVLVLEAGGPMTWDFGGREQMDFFGLFGGNSNVTVFDVPGLAMSLAVEGNKADRPEFWWDTIPWAAQGKGVGGSGSVNVAVSFTGSPEDFETWPEGWAYGDMKPFYKEVLEVANVGHISSADGELYLQASGDALNKVLTNQLGFKEAPLNESPVRVNTSSFTEYYSKGGQRFESCLAFLLPALNTKDNIELEVNSLVKRVMFSKSGLASGVELENGRVFHLNEGGKVVSTAGPLNTPKLLMYSGIGPASELERLDKNGLVHNPRELWIFNEEVGTLIHDHIILGMKVLPPATSETIQYAADFNDTQGLSDYFNERSGFLTQYLIPRLGFLTMPGRSAPDFEIGALSLNIVGEPPAGACPGCFDLFVLHLKPKSKDTLRINTPDLNCSCGDRVCKVGDFCVLNVYLANEKDLSEMVWAFQTLMKAFKSDGFKVISPPSDDPASLQEFLSALPVGVIAGYHFAGACSLGVCTDKNLKVKGTDNVFVADSSIFPDPVRSHNVLTSIAVGRKAASHISNA